MTAGDDPTNHEPPLQLVLDDDPTGVQAVHGVPVITTWDDDALGWALRQPFGTVFILTNSRALPAERASELGYDIACRALRLAGRLGREVVFSSRSDSTLRGHFPQETDALVRAWRDVRGVEVDGVLLCPAFFEAGRWTAGDTHWAEQDGVAVPVGDTPYAQDATFGFASSDLRAWVQERTNGRTAARDVVSVSLEDVRAGGSGRVAERLGEARDAVPVVINAESYDDLEVVVAGLHQARLAGRHFVHRVGPSFPRALGGITAPVLVDASALPRSEARHGLVVVGSHVPATTVQLAHARALPGVHPIELPVPTLLDVDRRDAALARATAEVNAALADADVIIFTSREAVAAFPDRPGTPLDVGTVVSAALVQLVQGVDLAPLRWLIAKGGITSSDIGTRALGVRRATVAGPLLPPGLVPVWVLPDDSIAPGLPYVIFPGNVGGPSALADAIIRLRGPA